MKLTWIVTASLLSITAFSPAFAADLVKTSQTAPAYNPPTYTYAQSPASYNNHYDFTGGYAGVQIGGSWFNQDLSVVGYNVSDYLAKPQGFFGGLFLGYNYQFSNKWIAGIDTDFNWGDVSESVDYVLENPAILASHKLKQNWNGATRLRLGYGADRFMPYVAAGVAYTGFTNMLSASYDNQSISISAKDTRAGFTVGAGLDYAMFDNMLLRLEYRYNDYGSLSGAVNIDATQYDLKADYYSNDIRAGIAYKF